jgi:DNA-binding NtrC family response regulator
MDRILLIEDDAWMAQAMLALVESWAIRAEHAPSAEAGLAALENESFDLVLTDIRMPGASGFDVLRQVKERWPRLPVILVTGHGDVADAVSAIKQGAFDYMIKPVDADSFEATVRRALEHGRLRRENDFLRRELAAGSALGQRMIGRSPRMREVFDILDRVSVTDSTVLLVSETGTGKELAAQTIHLRSKRAAGPYVTCNCAAFSPTLLESELFGHERGAFTGAISLRRGRFEEADGGTIFLDEIGETSREFQAKLLRVLQEREIERVGSSRKLQVNVRIIASTNRDLEKEVAEGRFRQDLYYRLRVVPVVLPPLRERAEDIPELARHFMAQFCAQYDRPPLELEPAALERLARHSWPGNVRELKHAIERAVLLARGPRLTAADVEVEPPSAASLTESTALTLQDRVDDATRRFVLEALERAGGEKKKAAEALGIDRVTLHRILRRLGVTPTSAID